MDKKISDLMLEEAANALRAQNQQKNEASDRLVHLADDLDNLNNTNRMNNKNLDDMLLIAEEMLRKNSLTSCEITEQGKNLGNSLTSLNDTEKNQIPLLHFKEIDTIEIPENNEWNQYLERIEGYANKHSLDLSQDPFKHLLSANEQAMIAKRIRDDYTMQKADCDKLDYMIGSFSGVVCGLIDSFFVGMPGSSKLGNWTNDQTDKFVVKTAKMLNYKPINNGNNEIANAISFMENRYKVNYDQATGKSASGLFDMSMSNHHIKSIAHAPDLVGLLFSILDQFSSTSHFLDNGRMITFNTDTHTLNGGTFIAKLYCGIINWAGHLISDMAGSSTTRRSNPDATGSGIPIPLFELFQTIGSGKFDISNDSRKTINNSDLSFADLSVKVFEEGYDARFGMAQAIPVIINELMIRFLWAMKSRFVDHLSWKECIPLGSNPNLRRVLLTGHGVLCLVDGLDAGLRSGGNVLNFALHLNFIAWKRLAFSGILEARAMYRENSLDLNAMEKDLEKEWVAIFETVK